jgi:acetyltransferase-like isoleucine patch superfamily enzyme
MGMRIGRDVHINSTAIADPSMIEFGNSVTIGGSASIMAHYAQGGYLIIAPVRIGAGATIGLRAIIMGGVEVGEKAKVLAGSFVLPNTRIPAGELWGGIPAQRIEREDSLPDAAASD